MTISIEDINEEKLQEEQTGELPFYKSPDKVSPPVKPFNRESKMSKKESTKYQPSIPRKTVDIPNPTSMRMGTFRNDFEDDQQLVIGKTITINGDISSCKTLIIEGKVEANVSDVVSINIAPGGIFKGNAKVANAFIAGSFDGSLEASKELEISETGNVNGTIKYRNISISNGGILTGDVTIIKNIDIKEKKN